MEDERLKLALTVTKNDLQAALNLLNLIDFSMRKGSKFPDVKMVLPDEDSKNE